MGSLLGFFFDKEEKFSIGRNQAIDFLVADSLGTCFSFSNDTWHWIRIGVNMVQLFHWMAARPLFFMLLWPSLCILIIALGWGTTENLVEDNVSEQWIPTRGVYAANQRYARSVSGDGGLGATTLAAMAIARDGGNLFTAERLETIRARMERAETIEVRRR